MAVQFPVDSCDSDLRLKQLYGMDLDLYVQVAMQILENKRMYSGLDCSKAFGIFMDAMSEYAGRCKDGGTCSRRQQQAYAFCKLRVFLLCSRDRYVMGRTHV